MFKKFAAAAVMTAACLSFATVAQATDIPATPMNSGPLVMSGMGPVGALFNVGVTPVNMVAAITTPQVAPMAEPMVKKHHRRRMKHMMKKKM